MNRDDVIRMAKEAGVWTAMTGENKEIEEQRLERFAALVAAAEREECRRIAWTMIRDGVDAVRVDKAIRARENT